MKKPPRKKAAGTRAAKTLSADKAQAALGKAGTSDAQLRKTFGTAKDAPRKG